jgi:dUTP pyrophosphatase
MKLQVKIKLTNRAVVPFYASKGAACFDIVAREIKYADNGVVVVHTGLFFELPEGYKLTVQPRSSFTGCNWILQNSPAQIDSDYRGELLLKFKWINGTGIPDFPYTTGDRCAQGAIEEVIQAEFSVVTELGETERGTGGFGSTVKIKYYDSKN